MSALGKGVSLRGTSQQAPADGGAVCLTRSCLHYLGTSIRPHLTRAQCINHPFGNRSTLCHYHHAPYAIILATQAQNNGCARAGLPSGWHHPELLKSYFQVAFDK